MNTQSKEQRRTQWAEAIDQELQYLITQAAEIRREITNAKTPTKRKYFEKKFKKIQPQVLQMVAAHQSLLTMGPNMNVPDLGAENDASPTL